MTDAGVVLRKCWRRCCVGAARCCVDHAEAEHELNHNSHTHMAKMRQLRRHLLTCKRLSGHAQRVGIFVYDECDARNNQPELRISHLCGMVTSIGRAQREEYSACAA
eukprot:2409788-Pyramimonas_sp.AAC.1